MLTASQQHCLRGIGIRLWQERSADETRPPDAVATADDAETAIAPVSPPRQSPAVADSAVPAKPAATVASTEFREPPRDLPQQSAPAEEPVATTQEPASTRVALDDWDSTIAAIHACTACELARHCTQKVPGVGRRQAELLIIGEGPGHDEDIRGEPFVGRSGQLLDRMLAAIGIAREDVYITNIVKCRPPDNRDPKPEEARHCRAFLEAQIKLIDPRIILSVGRVSAHNLLDTKQPVGKLIKQMHQLPGTDIPVKVTYHPAYLLRNPAAKAVAWQDLKLLHRMLQ